MVLLDSSSSFLSLLSSASYYSILRPICLRESSFTWTVIWYFWTYSSFSRKLLVYSPCLSCNSVFRSLTFLASSVSVEFAMLIPPAGETSWTLGRALWGFLPYSLGLPVSKGLLIGSKLVTASLTSAKLYSEAGPSSVSSGALSLSWAQNELGKYVCTFFEKSCLLSCSALMKARSLATSWSSICRNYFLRTISTNACSYAWGTWAGFLR